jgi:hypothetical protein
MFLSSFEKLAWMSIETRENQNCHCNSSQTFSPLALAATSRAKA